MTKITVEYKRQLKWRNWQSYINQLPISQSELILDLGCGTGDVSSLLAKKASKVIGIDFNKELIDFAQIENQQSNVQYICKDLKKIDEIGLSKVDGIWSSFSVAYFPDFVPVLREWLKLLKPNGWIALVEVDDLFAHKPIDYEIRKTFNSYYELQRQNNIYDFKMGTKLKDYLAKENVKIEFEQNKLDKELVFDGIADKEIINAWENRLDRMNMLRDFFGDERFTIAKQQFLETLQLDNHKCETKINFIVGRK